jgi:hypothetical protein
MMQRFQNGVRHAINNSELGISIDSPERRRMALEKTTRCSVVLNQGDNLSDMLTASMRTNLLLVHITRVMGYASG